MENSTENPKSKTKEAEQFIFQDGMYKSDLFIQFEKDCCEAYNIIRKEGHKLINLFLLMMSAGLPELNHEKDLDYLIKKLRLDKSEPAAAKDFKKEIYRAMNTKIRRWDNLAHNIK